MNALSWTEAEIGNATGRQAWIWRVGDDWLYELADRDGSNSAPEVVVAKLWLIGRAYAAPIERAATGMSAERIYQAAAGKIVESDLHSRLDRLKARSELNEACLRDSIGMHAALTRILRNVTGRSHPSLASKYLHFHAPNQVFIYDSRVAEELRKLFRGMVTPSRFREDSIPEYHVVAYRAFLLREQIWEDYALRLTPREMDRLLWRISMVAPGPSDD